MRWQVFNNGVLLSDQDNADIGLHDSGALILHVNGQVDEVFARGSWTSASRIPEREE